MPNRKLLLALLVSALSFRVCAADAPASAPATTQAAPNPEAQRLFNDGRQLYFDKKFADAAAAFDRALAIDPDFHLARRGLIEALIALGKPAQAMQQLIELARRNPDDPQVHDALAQAYQQQGHI